MQYLQETSWCNHGGLHLAVACPLTLVDRDLCLTGPLQSPKLIILLCNISEIRSAAFSITHLPLMMLISEGSVSQFSSPISVIELTVPLSRRTDARHKLTANMAVIKWASFSSPPLLYYMWRLILIPSRLSTTLMLSKCSGQTNLHLRFCSLLTHCWCLVNGLCVCLYLFSEIILIIFNVKLLIRLTAHQESLLCDMAWPLQLKFILLQIVEMSDGDDKPENGSGDSICRDYIRGVCGRKFCKYKHENEIRSLSFCHDFQNTGCPRPNCK